MKKLTDEAVAKALGWRRIIQHDYPKRKKVYVWRLIEFKDGGHKGQASYKFIDDGKAFPAFTTSLDAIVGEIEARGLYPCFAKRLPKVYVAWLADETYEHRAETSPLALCAALLSYIRDNKA